VIFALTRITKKTGLPGRLFWWSSSSSMRDLEKAHLFFEYEDLPVLGFHRLPQDTGGFGTAF
jgi:hypothetical protein